jgi:hypothetical protein
VARWPLFAHPCCTESVGALGREAGPLQGLYLHTREYKTQNGRTKPCMPRVGFEPRTAAFEQNTAHAADSAVTMGGKGTYPRAAHATEASDREVTVSAKGTHPPR